MNTNDRETPYDRREARRQRRAMRGGGEWAGGVILILLGLLLFWQYNNMLDFENWWALFILLPAVGSFAAAWRIYNTDGRFTRRSRSAAIIGFFLTLVSVMFVFNMNWIALGPILLILAGISIFVNALLPE